MCTCKNIYIVYKRHLSHLSVSNYSGQWNVCDNWRDKFFYRVHILYSPSLLHLTTLGRSFSCHVVNTAPLSSYIVTKFRLPMLIMLLQLQSIRSATLLPSMIKRDCWNNSKLLILIIESISYPPERQNQASPTVSRLRSKFSYAACTSRFPAPCILHLESILRIADFEIASLNCCSVESCFDSNL